VIQVNRDYRVILAQLAHKAKRDLRDLKAFRE
jgi:hypothetical protein